MVENIESSIEHYAELFGHNNISKVINVISQKVRVCFVKISEGNFIELVEPIGSESVVHNLLKKNITYYHIAYKVKDIQKMVERLEIINYKKLESFYSEAFSGKQCVFLYTPDGHLVELIEE